MKIFSAAIAAITIINKPANAQLTGSHLRALVEGTSTSDASGLGFDPQQWGGFDVKANEFDRDYMGNYETIDTTIISQEFSGVGSAWVFDLGSTGSLMRSRGAVITLSEIRAIWHELSPIVTENNGVVMKSVGDSLFLFFDNVSDGLTATRAMYLAVIDRWRMKCELACSNVDSPAEWCGDETEQRKRFYNTGAIGGAYGEMLLISEDGLIDAYGSAVNNAFFAGEEEAEHGEFLIDEGALQHLVQEGGGVPQGKACKNEVVNWTTGDLGVDHIDVKKYGWGGCYYRVCFDSVCQIPDDE